jgi:hypothetical protein
MSGVRRLDIDDLTATCQERRARDPRMERGLRWLEAP